MNFLKLSFAEVSYLTLPHVALKIYGYSYKILKFSICFDVNISAAVRDSAQRRFVLLSKMNKRSAYCNTTEMETGSFTVFVRHLVGWLITSNYIILQYFLAKAQKPVQF